MGIKFSTYKEASEAAKHLSKEGNKASVTRDKDHKDTWVVTILGEQKKQSPEYDMSQISVGKFPKTGVVVVFVGIDGIDNIYGYDSNRDLMRQFQPYQKNMAQNVSKYEKNVAIKKYITWKKTYADSFISKERAVVTEKKNKAIQKHKEYLKKIGKDYTGVELKPLSKHYENYCWFCKGPLDSDFHIACNSCNWLICECGACGCGYERKT